MSPDKKKKLDEIRNAHNQELLKILEEEQSNEAGREAKLKEITDINEKQRLEKIFGIERARASERIVKTSQQHEENIMEEMKKFGII